MTDNKGTQTMHAKPLVMTGTGILALALLTGCTTADPGTNETAAGDGAATATTAPAGTSPATGDGDDADDQGTATSGTDDDDRTDDADDQSPGSATPTSGSPAGTASGEDPVFAAIEALYAEHDGAVIVQVDREDGDAHFEIEAVVGETLTDYRVGTDGTVREDDDDNDDDDDVRKAREAQVVAEEAARAALEGREGQTIDDMELDEENGTLVWEVSLDRDQGGDGDDLLVDATTGEVRND